MAKSRHIRKLDDAAREQVARDTDGNPILDLEQHSNEGSSPYIDYLHADVLHTLQNPRSDHPDEMTFIVMAHTIELMFRLIGDDLERCQRCLRESDLPGAHNIFSKVHTVLSHLCDTWSVVSTITPSGYLAFRDNLGISSGFGSFMYRRLEFLLGNKQERMLKPHQQVPEIHAMLNDTLRRPSIYDDAIILLEKHGLSIDKDCINRDWSCAYESNDTVREAWVKIYTERGTADPLYVLAEDLIGVADRFKVWRYRHFVSVERLIGMKPGTGGTSGIGWLRAIIDHNFFPEIWEARTHF